jgi:hypothetical protein
MVKPAPYPCAFYSNYFSGDAIFWRYNKEKKSRRKIAINKKEEEEENFF